MSSQHRKPTRFNFSRYELPELIDLHRYEIGVEVGVNLGQFSYYLLKYSKLALLYSVDSYPGKYRQAKRGAQTLLEEFKTCKRSSLLVQTSIAAAQDLRTVPIDFVYIDAGHDRANIAADIHAWAPLVQSGGLLSGHDYTERHSGVIDAVNEFAAERDLQLYLTREAWSSWMFFMP